MEGADEPIDLDPFWLFYNKSLKNKNGLDVLKMSRKKSYSKNKKINLLPIYELNTLIDYIFGVAPRIPKTIGLDAKKQSALAKNSNGGDIEELQVIVVTILA